MIRIKEDMDIDTMDTDDDPVSNQYTNLLSQYSGNEISLLSYLIDINKTDDYWREVSGGNDFYLNKYRMNDYVGKGSYGVIVTAEKKTKLNERELIAIKILLPQEVDEDVYDERSLSIELNILD